MEVIDLTITKYPYLKNAHTEQEIWLATYSGEFLLLQQCFTPTILESPQRRPVQ